MITIGIDPHKSTLTAVGLSPDGTILATTRLPVNTTTLGELLAFADSWPQRQWAVEGAAGLGLGIAQRLVAPFCHGDWTDGNLLAVDASITAILDWEAAHLGDRLRELSRAAWGAARKYSRSLEALASGYGVDPALVRAWLPIHAAELWLWFAEAGPAEYFEQLTEELVRWPCL